MSVQGSILGYLAVASLLLMLAVARSWHFYDLYVDRWLALVLLLLVATIAGANDLGTDVSSYRDYYDQLWGYSDRYYWWEPGFELLATFFAGTGAPYGLFVFACVCMSNGLKLWVFDELCANRMLAFFAMFCLNLCEVAFVRQYLAASLILLAFLFMGKGRIFAAVLVVLAATLIHKSALIVGVLVLTLNLKRSSLLALGAFAVAAVVVAFLLPREALGSIAPRLISQISNYTDEGFVQGLDAGPVALFRNVAKFFFYFAIALWMVALPARTQAESLQRSAGFLVMAISLVSIPLIALLSPVFSRMSVFVFPFLAVSLRAERFRSIANLYIAQYATVTGFLVNLAFSIYPLIRDGAL